MEALVHGPNPVPDPGPAVLLLISLAAIAYAGFTGGLTMGLASAVLVAAYGMHALSPTRTVVFFGIEDLLRGLYLLVIGAAMAGTSAALKRRDDRYRDALVRQRDSLKATNAELREANDTLEAFTFVVAHDLKEPVRAVENYLAAAEASYGDEQGRRFLQRARESNERLAHLLGGLLEYARAGTPSGPLQVVDAADVLQREDCRSHYAEALRERGATLEVASHLPRVRADVVALAQVLGNVVLNAVRHDPSPKPTVRVHAEADGDRVTLLVDDNGPGFPEVVRERLQEEGPPSSTIKGGFGLLIALRAVRGMGGDLAVENRPGGGGRVRVVLPSAGAAEAGPPVSGGTRWSI